MASYIVQQPDGKFAIFSEVTDDFTSFGLSSIEALEWGTKKWGERIAAEKFASAMADEPIGLGGERSTDGLGRWRLSLTDISSAYGLNYLQTTLREIGFEGADIPQSAIDGVKLRAEVANVVPLVDHQQPPTKFEQSPISAYLLKLAKGRYGDEGSE